uniref:Uncharacterized protein n=1 Tax=Anopheles christyi TaxID=43041 RepID=A0A182KDF5_9DIPT
MYSSTFSDDDGALFQCSELTPRAPYRREFDEMEARIRKCERHRAELERQFEELMRERTECEKETVRAMKQRQRRRQEAERQRAERNESILRMLNKIDQQAASLAAKTDRLKMLKTQYEMYLMRTWSTSALPPVYSVPMLAAPPAMLTPLPQSPTKTSQKSEFVQYLSDLTHQQTATHNAIPPPMALSNYIASQKQKSYNAMPSIYGTSPERPYSRALTGNAPAQVLTSPSHPMVGGSTVTKKFEMSNEDFIRYIDSEVLKEPIPKVSIVAPSPSESVEVKKPSGAYLEDAVMSEDEPVGGEELVKKLEELNIMVGPGIKQHASDQQPQEDIEEVAEVVESGKMTHVLLEEEIIVISPFLCSHILDPKNVASPETIMQEKEDNFFQKSTLDETIKSDHETNVDTDSKAENAHILERAYDPTDEKVLEILEDLPAPATNALNDVVNIEPVNEEDHQTILQEEPNVTSYEAEYIASNIDANYQDTTRSTEEQLYAIDQSEHVPYDNQQYGTSNEAIKGEDNPANNPPQLQQAVNQFESKNQHWTTARQALRSKVLPVSSSKPPSPETDMTEQVAANETAALESAEAWNRNQEDVQVAYENAQPNTITQNDAANATYAEYGGQLNDSYYPAEPATSAQDGGQEIPSSKGEEYINDAMGQPVEYQQDDGQQAAQYQYGNNQDTVAYQEGQYNEGGTAEDSQYQYQAGVDPTGNAYATQEQYQDPNQQYQYDENAQYYNDQQAYDAQYYSQDPQQQEQQQQQQQQYYMDEANQQQAVPSDEYPATDPNDQSYYPPDGGQYEEPTTTQNPEPSQPTPAEESSSLEPAPLAGAQPTVETSAVIDATLPKDKQEKKASDALTQQATLEPSSSTGKAGGDPGSDAPTLSTVNDESDFDFSSQ